MLNYGAQDVVSTLNLLLALWLRLKINDASLSSPLGVVWEQFYDRDFIDAAC